jgi:hypothetical protein
MRIVASLGTAWSVTILGGGLVLALIVFKRWRHLVTFLIYLTVLGLVGTGVLLLTKRPRPYGVTIIGDWIGFSMPSSTSPTQRPAPHSRPPCCWPKPSPAPPRSPASSACRSGGTPTAAPSAPAKPDSPSLSPGPAPVDRPRRRRRAA